MGVYPNLGVMDAAIAIVHQGKERAIRASRILGSDRMDTRVGPISVQIVQPLHRIRLKVAKNKFGIAADLVFEARSLPVEEPHFLRRVGNNVAMDYTRMTQLGNWTGKLSLDGTAFDPVDPVVGHPRPLLRRSPPVANSSLPTAVAAWLCSG